MDTLPYTLRGDGDRDVSVFRSVPWAWKVYDKSIREADYLGQQRRPSPISQRFSSAIVATLQPTTSTVMPPRMQMATLESLGFKSVAREKALAQAAKAKLPALAAPEPSLSAPQPPRRGES